MLLRGWECTGLEPSKWATEQARKNTNLNIFNCSVEEAQSVLGGKRFDAIVSWDVIEHVSDPSFMIKVVSEHLKPDGIFAFSTLDVDSWFPKLMGKKWPWLMEMHLFYFTPKVLKNMLLKHGLELLKYGNYCHYASLRYMYQKFCFGMPNTIRPILLMGERLIPNWIVPVSLGDVKFFIARKTVG
jgi:SAM-dependent methyltransferase